MNQATKHTAAPWRMYDAHQHSPLRLIVQDTIGSPLVAEMVRTSAQENEANAAHIVRCVNLHDELVAALIELVRVDCLSEAGVYCPDRTAVQERAKAVLAKVQS